MGTARLGDLGLLARIWHSDLHFAAHGCTQPHTRLRGKITKAAKFPQVTGPYLRFWRVGRLGLEPRTGGL